MKFFIGVLFWFLVFVPGVVYGQAGCVYIGGSCSTFSCGCSVDADCHGCCVGPYNVNVWCVAGERCESGACYGISWRCESGVVPDGCSTDCFTPDTPVRTPEGEEAIVDLTEGDEVKTFDPETGSAGTGLVQKTFQYTRNAYYKIRTKDGQELKVTGTHPLLAVRTEGKPLSFWEYLKRESLTRKMIDSLF